MTWAGQRKFLIIAIVVSVVLALIAVTLIAVLYETPTCTDGKQNAEERGVDCGGACMYQCLADVETPSVRFVRAFSPQPGRYDVIAYVDNRNAMLASKGVRATVELFDENRTFVTKKDVLIDIPAGTTIPVYVPEAYRGAAVIGQAFLIFDEATLRFYEPKKKHVVPVVTNVETTNVEAPRIRAVLQNPTAFPLYEIKPIATVFDGEGNAIAASQTFLPQLGGQADASVLFTWNAPFTGIPARVEVLPVIPLTLP